MTYDLKKVQQALNDRGFEGANGLPLTIDGIAGPNTSHAIRSFKRSVGLADRDYVGPLTYAKLTGDDADVRAKVPNSRANPPWFNELLGMMGTHETRDHAALSLWLASDGATVGDPSSIPWCGDAVETAIRLALPGIPVPENPYLASNWTKWGVPCKPALGCLLVFWRGSPDSWQGHIGFYAGESDSSYYVLGGNQKNSVSIAPISKTRLRKGGSRWPDHTMHPDVPPPSDRVVRMSGGTISTNEA
jgi:uncharacterized protein (TIGR02594 family)